MEYDKLKKEELIELLGKRDDELIKKEHIIAALQQQIEEVPSLIATREQSIKYEHQLREENIMLKSENGNLKYERDKLINTLNELANLFGDTTTALKDLNSILGVVERNSKHVLENLEIKLDVFNRKNTEGMEETKR
jgi:hypothetical protein